ncbi:hypothetical protein G6F31_016533 [Rhizopus arrhizus]|nr:hypothetical protein G6F31_016533 [Rhizopus arrhizus]
MQRPVFTGRFFCALHGSTVILPAQNSRRAPPAAGAGARGRHGDPGAGAGARGPLRPHHAQPRAAGAPQGIRGSGRQPGLSGLAHHGVPPAAQLPGPRHGVRHHPDRHRDRAGSDAVLPGGRRADHRAVAGPVDLHARALAVPGDADDAVPVPAVDPAVRLHVPVRRHATAGAVAGRSAAADPLPATGARHHAARRLAVGAVARRTGAAGLHRGDDDAGDPALPQAPGLKHAIR